MLETSSSEIQETDIHPWMRWGARAFDMMTFKTVIVTFALILILLFNKPILSHWKGFPQFMRTIFEDKPINIIDILSSICYIFIEPLFFSIFGTTLGKALFGITVKNRSNNPLKYKEAFFRTLNVWVRGLGCCIPNLSFPIQVLAYFELTTKKITKWDKKGNFQVSHRKLGLFRKAIAWIYCCTTLILAYKIQKSDNLFSNLYNPICLILVSYIGILWIIFLEKCFKKYFENIQKCHSI